MIDTIKIARPISQSQFKALLDADIWQKEYHPHTRELKRLVFKEKGNNNPYLSGFLAPDKIGYLSARVSLPTFYYGSNAKLLTQEQVWEALGMLSQYISDKSFLDFNAMTANVWEVHFTQDLKFSDTSLKPLLNQIARMDIPRFEPGSYRNSTAYFHSGKARTWCIYDKGLDAEYKKFPKEDIKYCKNTLRMEFRYKTSASIKTLVKSEKLIDRQARTLFRQELSNKLIEPIKDQVLIMRKFSDTQAKIKFLFKKFGNRKASSLITHLTVRDYFNDKFYEDDEIGIKRSAYYTNQKICRDIGIYSLLDNSGNVKE